MSFVEPLFLFGLLAAALPVVVHLINRRKAVRRDFPALKFLMQSNRRESRGIKVRQWLLMALRILVVALLAFALAKPFVLSSAGVTASERLPTATVFVLDDSFSMQHGDWWERAMAALEKRQDRLRPWDEVALVTTGPGAPRLVGRLTGNHSELEDAVDALPPGAHATHLTDALLAASDILEASELPNRKIVVISDLARGGFDTAAQPGEPIPHEVELVSIRDEAEVPNLAVESVAYEQEGSTRDPVWRVEAMVRNFADEARKVEIRLTIDGAVVAGGLVDVPANESVKHIFRHKFEGSGVREGAVELIDSDGLSIDDRRIFVVRLRDAIRTLLVNGEPSSVPFHDEMFFLERALNPRMDTVSNVVPDLTTRDGLETAELSSYDVVVLANVSKLTPVTARKLQTFVEKGGGLMIAMGDQVDTADPRKFLIRGGRWRVVAYAACGRGGRHVVQRPGQSRRPGGLATGAAVAAVVAQPALAADTLDYGGIEMDLGAHKVRRDGQQVSLGPTEYRLLRHLLENPGRVFSRQQLLDALRHADVDEGPGAAAMRQEQGRLSHGAEMGARPLFCEGRRRCANLLYRPGKPISNGSIGRLLLLDRAPHPRRLRRRLQQRKTHPCPSLISIAPVPPKRSATPKRRRSPMSASGACAPKQHGPKWPPEPIAATRCAPGSRPKRPRPTPSPRSPDKSG